MVGIESLDINVIYRTLHCFMMGFVEHTLAFTGVCRVGGTKRVIVSFKNSRRALAVDMNHRDSSE